MSAVAIAPYPRTSPPCGRSATELKRQSNPTSLSAVMFLSAGFRLSDFAWVTHDAGHAEFFHQPEKPAHRPIGFNPHDDRRRQARIVVPHRRPVVLQRSLDDLPGL